MKKLLILLIASTFSIFSTAQSWKSMGGSNPFPNTLEHDFTILDNSRPVVVYVEDGSSLIQVQRWDGESWELLLQPTGQMVSDVQVTNIGNTIIVGYFENSSEYFVKEYDGAAWNQLGDIGITAELYDDVRMIQGANTGDLWVSFVNQSFDGVVRKWDGFTWSTHGSDIVMSAQNLYHGYPASDGTKSYFLTDDYGGLINSTLYTANESVPGYTQYGFNPVITDQNLVHMDCTPGQLPSIGYVEQGSPDYITFVRPDGLGDFTADESFHSPPGPVSNFDHEMGADDSIFFVYTDANGEVYVRHQEGGILYQYGVALNTNNPTETDIEVFKYSAKPYVMVKEDVFSKIYTFNNPPVYNSDAGANDLCQEEVSGSYLTSILFTDQDFDSVYVTAGSNTPLLLTSGNISISRINAYSSFSNQNEFSIEVTPEPGQSGIASVDLFVTDGLDTLIYPISIVINPMPTVSPTITNADCNGNCDGEIDLLASGGTTPYQYSINNGGMYQASSNFNLLCSGNYDILVQDNNGCTSTSSTETITEPTTVTYTPTLTSPLCNSGCDGEIDLAAAGGTSPYQYSINNGGMYQGSSNFNSLCAGNFDILIQDFNGCLSTATIETLTQPTVLVATAPVDMALCDGNPTTINGSASGGTPIYSFAWDQSVSDGLPFTPSGVGTLTYTLTVTDGNGCIDTDVMDITVNPLPTISGGIDLEGCDGNIFNLSGAGGVNYLWDNSVTDGVDFTPGVGTLTYTVTGTDVNGCENTDAVDITVYANPAAFTVTATNPTICGAANGSFLISGLAAGTPFNITYNDGAFQGPFAMTSDGSGNITIPSLAAGVYNDITVTNVNNCSTIDGSSYGLNDPSAPTVNAGVDMTVCEGEPVTLTAVNTENAQISWNNGILNGHTFFPTTTTTYSVTASSSGCTATDQVTITVNALPDVTLNVTNATCTAADGVVTSSISNGLPPYDVYWSNGTTGGDISGLEPALYYINVTDNNGCYTMEVATVSSTAMSINGVKTDNNCSGDEIGAVDLTVIGNGPFTYHWSNGDISEDISALTTGQYEVMVTDQNNCMSSASFVINEPLAIYGELVSTNATCGLSDGGITSTILGGSPIYSYQWKDGLGVDITGETADNISGFAANPYSLEVTDANGCLHELFGSISENNGPIVTVDSLINSTCADDGTINIDVNSGFAISSYLWSSGQTTEDLTPAGAGQYHITVEDVNGCYGVLAVNLPAVLPIINEICIVSVDDNTNTNLIIWEKPVTDGIAYFNVYRESSIAGMFQLVDSVSYNQVSEYNDTIAYPGLRSWRYKLGTVDTCGNESVLSEAHKTMHITYTENSGVYNLAWDHYEGFSYTTYYVWMHTDLDGWVEIDQLPITDLTYSHTPTDIVGIDYRVTIVPPSTCTSTAKATDYNSSRSNKSEESGVTENGPSDVGINETNIEFEIYPNPTEGQFKINMGDLDNYQISIFDVSGKLVYKEMVNEANTLLNISHLESGSYLVKIKSDDKEGIQQLIKH